MVFCLLAAQKNGERNARKNRKVKQESTEGAGLNFNSGKGKMCFLYKAYDLYS